MSILSSLLGGLGLKAGGQYQSQSGAQKQLGSQYQGTSTQNVNPYITPEYLALLGQQQSEYGQIAAKSGAGYQGLLDQAQKQVQNYGQVQQTQLKNFYAQQQAQQQQNLINRGLGNSTIANSVQSGLAGQENIGEQNLAQNISQYGTNVLGQFGLPQQQAYLGLGMGAVGAETGVGQQYLGLLGGQGTTLQTNAGVTSGYGQGTSSGYGLGAQAGLNAGSLGNQDPYANALAKLLGGQGGGQNGFLGGGQQSGGYYPVSQYYGA
jgi:hypothetical protein